MAPSKVQSKISGFIGSDTEDEMHVDEEQSILSPETHPKSTTAAKKRAGSTKNTASKVAKANAPRKPHTTAQTTGKKGSKKAADAKRSALEEQVNGQSNNTANNTVEELEAPNDQPESSEDELESPKTIADQAKQQKPKTKGQKIKEDAAVEQEDEVDHTPTIARQSKVQGASQNKPAVVKKAPARRKAPAVSQSKRQIIPETQPEPMEIDQTVLSIDGQDGMEEPSRPIPRPRVRAESRSRQDPTMRRRAGSASDTERTGNDPAMRRRLGDLTRKFENVDLKYRNLRDVGVNEANANMEKLRKQCEVTTAASNELVASLKKELAAQAALAQESKKLQKNLQAKDAETTKLQSAVGELTSDLDTARNEIKALQARLAASRSASVAVESVNAKTPASAMKNNQQTRTIMVGSAEAAQAAQVAQLKEDLYSDLTGLILRGAKRADAEDTYDCLQTGRNGTLHFKLNVANDADGKTTSFDDTEFLYTPLLDSNRDRELLELLPDYLTEEITFARQHAAKFYSRVVDALTKRRTDE